LNGEPLIYLVMEGANGNLSEVIPTRLIAAEEAREMLRPALSALAHVHGHAFFHGHLKPANVLAVDGQLRISSDNLCRIGDTAVSQRQCLHSTRDRGHLAGRRRLVAGHDTGRGPDATSACPPPNKQHEPVVPETLPEPFLEIARHCLRSNPPSRWTVADIAARLEMLDARHITKVGSCLILRPSCTSLRRPDPIPSGCRFPGSI